MKTTLKIILSLFLIIGSLCCFIYKPPLIKTISTTSVVVSSKEQKTETIEIQKTGIAKFLEWLSLGALILAVWLWRKELGVSKLGPLSGIDQVSQQPAGSPQKPVEESGPVPSLDISSISEDLANDEMKKRLEHIMQMFRKMHSVNVSYVANEFRISSGDAKNLLFYLTKMGALRADGFPKKTIYTPSKSIENLTLDTVKQRLSEKHEILSERRFVRIKGKYEIDSLLESDDRTFIIEAKVLRKHTFLPQFEHWITALMTVANEFKNKKMMCILAIVCLGNLKVVDVKKQIDSFTFDTGTIPLEALVFSETELQ